MTRGFGLSWALPAGHWAFGLVGSVSLGRRLGFGIFMFILAELPRILLPLPIVSKPRIYPEPAWLIVLGALIFVGSLFFGTPVLRIIPLTGPDSREPLRTDGLYALVRHPLMLYDIFWPLGWSLIFGSLIGAALTPLWLLIIWALTHVEEEALVREYGDAYRQYQSRVPRLLPCVPGLSGGDTASR